MSSDKATTYNLLLVGNPNVGKSVVFHKLTGSYATVSNYPGQPLEIIVTEPNHMNVE